MTKHAPTLQEFIDGLSPLLVPRSNFDVFNYDVTNYFLVAYYYCRLHHRLHVKVEIPIGHQDKQDMYIMISAAAFVHRHENTHVSVDAAVKFYNSRIPKTSEHLA